MSWDAVTHRFARKKLRGRAEREARGGTAATRKAATGRPPSAMAGRGAGAASHPGGGGRGAHCGICAGLVGLLHAPNAVADDIMRAGE
jgi:hypothetical protein